MTEDRQAVFAMCGIAAGVVVTVRCVRWWWKLREEKQRERTRRRMYGEVER